MKRSSLLILLLLSGSIISFSQTFQSKHFTIQKLTDGVYAAIATKDGYAISNSGIIDLGDAALIFDTFMTPEAAEDLKKAAELLTGNKIKYVVNSHYHNDHIGGNQVFDNAVIISTERTRELIAKFQPEEIDDDKIQAPLQLEKLKKRDTSELSNHALEEFNMQKTYFEALKNSGPDLKVVLPDLTFSDLLILHGSKRTVKLLSFGTGHTESDLFLLLPDEQIAFMGDLLFIQNHPYLADGNPDKWKMYLDGIKKLNLKTLVPGHGPVGTPADIDTLELYFDNVRNSAKAYHTRGIQPRNDSTLVAPSRYRSWFLSDFYKSNVSSEYNRLYKK